MKLVIASDIHGSYTNANKLIDHYDQLGADKLLLLGDILYHGARNQLTDGYDTMATANLFDDIAEQIVAVRGNCDSEVDQVVLAFPMMDDSARVVIDGTEMFLTHGHIYPPDPTLPGFPQLPLGTVFLSGHTHIKRLEEQGGYLFLNPGSTSIPRDGIASFATFEDGVFALRRLDDGAAIKKLAVG